MVFEVSKKIPSAHEEGIWSIVWNKNSIFSASEDCTTKRWNSETLKQELTLGGSHLGIVCIAVEENLVACSSLDSHIRIYENGDLLKNIDCGPVENWGVAFSRDSKYVASSGQSGNITFWNVETGGKEQVLNTNGKFTMSVAYSPDGKYIACGALDGVVTVFDVQESKRLHSIQASAMAIRSVTFSPDSNLLLAASDDMQVKIYNTKASEHIGSFFRTCFMGTFCCT